MARGFFGELAKFCAIEDHAEAVCALLVIVDRARHFAGHFAGATSTFLIDSVQLLKKVPKDHVVRVCSRFVDSESVCSIIVTRSAYTTFCDVQSIS